MKQMWKRFVAFAIIFCTAFGLVLPVQASAASATPVVTATYSVMDQVATIKYDVKSTYKIKSVIYVKGEITDPESSVFKKSGITVTNYNEFPVTESGVYTILAEDTKGNKGLVTLSVTVEFRAVWISYLEFSSSGYTEAAFKKHINQMFDNVVSMNMTAVVVQVRPFGDAFYPSYYFPWSKYVSGEQGKNPGYDPLAYMVEAAHERGLEFHAWLNPYRVTTNNTDVTTLASTNLARKWLTDKSTANDRYVLSYGGNLYFNPAVTAVQNTIVKGVKEIVQKYDVDGIHLDDYFYPTFGNNYAKEFDAAEYETYKAACIKKGTSYLSIADWRRNNVNTLVKNIYTVIKKVNPNVQFGISPAGYYDKLMMDDRYYVDIKTWLSKDGYVDYICPQIYWSFSHPTYPFKETVEKWMGYRTNSSVKLYVGIPVYKAGSDTETEFKNNQNILAEMIQCGRESGSVDGYMFFRYAYFYNSATKKAVNKLLTYLAQ